MQAAANRPAKMNGVGSWKYWVRKSAVPYQTPMSRPIAYRMTKEAALTYKMRGGQLPTSSNWPTRTRTDRLQGSSPFQNVIRPVVRAARQDRRAEPTRKYWRGFATMSGDCPWMMLRRARSFA